MSRISPTQLPQAFVGRGIEVWPLAVVEVRDLGRAMRRLTLGGEALRSFACEAGNDVMVPLSEDGGPTLCRRYTVRHVDAAAARLDLDVVLHGDGIGARWAASAQVGEQVEVGGPRGKITLAKGAAWHLFAGDESAIPATFAMMEALPAGVPSRALLAIDEDGDEQPHRAAAGAHVTWVRRGVGAGVSRLVDALRTVEIPEGTGHVYLAGEDDLVAALKQAAVDRGIAAPAISAKAYWSRRSRNREHGEP
ncbi:MAG TPA: siderophore-interacting protein [Polyangiaceae bacterium]|jgi:NADPH-dependent ferric siderophore reductase